MQAKKTSNESDDKFLRRFNTLKSQIENEVNDHAKIEVILILAGLDELMQQKIRKQSSMPETKNDLVALSKKLRPDLDREPKSSLPTRTRTTPSTFAQSEQSDAAVASSLYEGSCKKEAFCSYCERNCHKEAQRQKKLAMLSKAKGPSQMKLEHRLL